MGSLMSGWDSPANDLKAEKLRRNKSLTRGEIDAFWRSKKQTEEEHRLQHVSSLSPRPVQSSSIFKEDEGSIRYQRSISMPCDPSGKINDDKRSPTLDKIIQNNGWWVSSNLAFLNEPPVIAADGPNYKYASHYHVASKPNSHAGIGASSSD